MTNTFRIDLDFFGRIFTITGTNIFKLATDDIGGVYHERFENVRVWRRLGGGLEEEILGEDARCFVKFNEQKLIDVVLRDFWARAEW